MRLRCRFGIHRYDNSTMLPVKHVRVAWLECDCHDETAWSINSWHGGIEDDIWICDNCGRKKRDP